MKKQQQWVKDLMFNIISLMNKNDYNGDMCTEGYKYTINGAIDNYSQTYWDEKEGKNISLFHKYYKFEYGIYKNVLMSKNAYDCLCDFIEKEKIIDKDMVKKEIKIMNKKLHGEHLTPQSYTRRKLNDLIGKKLTDYELKKEIDYAFTDAKLCIITKNESALLDAKNQKFSKDEIASFLTEYKKIHTKLSAHIESDFRDLEGKTKRNNGFGSIRLFVLQNNNVIFVDSNGKIKSFEECVSYLEDDNYFL